MIRNFCIISHIDHGKSTLADRLLEITNTIPEDKMESCHLDAMDLEKEKGITIKMHPVRMKYKEYILNLIDTPGHVDFSYETSRALACVEGALLLVDATKGVQAQTIFNLDTAKKQGVQVIGAVNKVDVADPDMVADTKKELASILDQDESQIFEISAKTGLGVEKLLEEVIKFDEPKKGEGNTKALIFDSKYDYFAGVIAYVRIFGGSIKKNDRLMFKADKEQLSVKEVGYFVPDLTESEELKDGEIGYIKTGIKEPGLVKVGDTILKEGDALDGYKDPQPVMYLSVYPENPTEFDLLQESLERLHLTDPSLSFEIESKTALGRGFRMGFLGNLQAEIILRRLKEEFNIDLVSTIPQVVFKVIMKDGREELISSPSSWPEANMINGSFEPYCDIEIVAPNDYFSQIFKLFDIYSVTLKDSRNISANRTIIEAEGPLREIVSGGFYDDLKSSTQGYASFSFQQSDFKPAELVRVDILIAGNIEDAFSRIVPKYKAYDESKKFLDKLEKSLPRQQFDLALQAAIGGKIIARNTIRARRKDVTGALYGGDVTRKKKLLQIQKRGKKKLKEGASVKIPAESFIEILKN